MTDINHQHIQGNVEQVNGILHTGNRLEVHQHFLSKVDRSRIVRQLMAFKESDPDFFKLIQNICTELHGNFMFKDLEDEQLQRFYEVQKLVFDLFRQKEEHRLTVIKLTQKLEKSTKSPLKNLVKLWLERD